MVHLELQRHLVHEAALHRPRQQGPEDETHEERRQEQREAVDLEAAPHGQLKPPLALPAGLRDRPVEELADANVRAHASVLDRRTAARKPKGLLRSQLRKRLEDASTSLKQRSGGLR